MSTLTIEKCNPGRGVNDIKITRTSEGQGVQYFFMTQEVLKELVFWSAWYGERTYEDAYAAMGVDLKPGEVTHVG
jgi:hypothetical protein